MAYSNIGGYRGWYLQAEISGTTKNSISVNARIYASSGYSCAWGARTMTMTCNGQTKTASINAMNNSGNTYSNVASATFTDLSPSTTYTVGFSYDVRATLSNVYQGTWSGSLQATTAALPTYSVNVYISNMNEYGNYGSAWLWKSTTVSEGGSVSWTAYSGDATYNDLSYSKSNITSNVSETIYASRKTGSFNLNILMPDDSEPYTTGRAGKVQMSTDGGSTWSDYLINEPASSYYRGRSLKFRNFVPGEGLYLASVSGVDSNWAVTQDDAVTVDFHTEYNSYYLDLNGLLDGTNSGGLENYGRANVTVNGSLVGNQVNDYCTKHLYNASYSISNITPLSGYRYNGLASGSGALSGTIGLGKDVRLSFSTIEPSNLQINGSTTSPFTIDLNWSSEGINITNYTIYYNGVAKNCGTATSTTLEVNEETTYNIYFTATNAGGTTTSSSISITTPSDQAKIRIKGKELPDTLQKVEYIQTDGAQLINLGKVGDSVAHYDIQFMADNHRQLMGYGGSGSEYWGASDSTMYEAGGSRGPSIDTTQRRNIVWTYNYRDGVTKVEYDGNTITNTPSKNVDDSDYKLFNILPDASATYGCACKLYGLTIYHYDNKVHELIPCYRKSDGVIGLYDNAGGKFYTNEGTGSFAKGPDVQAGSGWLKGKTYLKRNGAWVKAKKIYIKVDGQWKIGSNYES